MASDSAFVTLSGSSSAAVRHRSAVARAAAAVDRATLVTFTVGSDTLAAPVESVERVLRVAGPSRIPGMPEWLEGVIEHRGVMVPVIDLRRRLGRAQLESGANSRIIVFNTQPDWLAAIVDTVTEVVTVDAATIVPPPSLVRGLSGAYLLGMVTHREQVVLVLDIAKLLTAAEVLELTDLPEPAIFATAATNVLASSECAASALPASALPASALPASALPASAVLSAGRATTEGSR